MVKQAAAFGSSYAYGAVLSTSTIGSVFISTSSFIYDDSFVGRTEQLC